MVSSKVTLGVMLATVATVVALQGSPTAAIGPRNEEILKVGEIGGMSAATEQAIGEAATRSGARWVTFHRGTLQLLSVERGDETIQAPSPGYFYPMAATAVDALRAAPLLGGEVAEVLASGALVFGETSARLRGALPGDTVTLVGWNGASHRFAVGAVVPDAVIDWDELALDIRIAESIGFIRASYVAVWDYDTADEFLLSLFGRTGDALLTVRAPLDPADPDSVLPVAVVKERFGEFSYRPTDGDRVIVSSDWVEANIVDVDLPYLGAFRCHKDVAPLIAGALAEIEEVDLAWMIDYQDFQIAGGCYNPRLIRGGDKGGAVSRHTWGIAIDINPSDNPYGGSVEMDERIAEIFRKWGFAWGGGWRYPDGGHFEWSHPAD